MSTTFAGSSKSNARALVCDGCDREFAVHIGDEEQADACPFCECTELRVRNTSVRMEVGV